MMNPKSSASLNALAQNDEKDSIMPTMIAPSAPSG